MNIELENQINERMRLVVTAFFNRNNAEARFNNEIASKLIHERSEADIKEMEESRKRIVKHG